MRKRSGKGPESEKGGCRASMTVEAAIVMSTLLMILMGCMKETIVLYQQVKESAGLCWIEIEDIDRTFRMFSLAREVTK